MAKRNKRRTLKQKRAETFRNQHGMDPQEFLDNIKNLPNHIRTKKNIREARALV